ncbi:MAG: hypothetical protein CM1200mP34_1690 [Verrucomicrobiales bacterium]|nr:MAG: hypothetical protein CM1200mP34_1690 [Verrucomicrobiales bacterium]
MVGKLNDYKKNGGSLKDLRKRIDDHGLTVESAIGFARWIVDETHSGPRDWRRPGATWICWPNSGPSVSPLRRPVPAARSTRWRRRPIPCAARER